MKKFNLKLLSVPELLRCHSAILDELKRQGVVRTHNNPTGDYAERLCKTKLQLSLEGSSNRGYDAKDKYYRRYEIKARREKKVWVFDTVCDSKLESQDFPLSDSGATLQRFFGVSCI